MHGRAGELKKALFEGSRKLSNVNCECKKCIPIPKYAQNYFDLKRKKTVFGTEGKMHYFGISFEPNVLGSLVHLHLKRKDQEILPFENRTYHTYLLADCPEFARIELQKKGLI